MYMIMASNDSGVDTSNDSNDGGNNSTAAEAASSSKIAELGMTSAFSGASAPGWVPLPVGSNVYTHLKFPIDSNDPDSPEFVFPRTVPLDTAIIRPSTLPSGSHSFKMRIRMRSRLHSSSFPNILAQSNGRKLRTASSTCNIELLTKLLDGGTDPNSSDEHKRSPLHLAACRGYVQIVSQLLKYGANPNIVDSLGNTPLHLAVVSASSNNFNIVVRMLLEGGASVYLLDSSGKTALELAESKLRLMRTRYQNLTPESAKIIEDMCLLTTLILRYLLQQKQDIEDLIGLEKKFKNLSTDVQILSEADSLLASVERLSITK